MAPVLTAVGVPADGIGILLAVDAIPDMFRTTANVTGTMAVAAFLARMGHRGGEAQSPVQRQAFGGK
jgi:proton glutamate symport protein